MVCPRDGLQKGQGDSALHLGKGCGCGWCLLGAPRVQRLALRRHRSPAEAEARGDKTDASVLCVLGILAAQLDACKGCDSCCVAAMPDDATPDLGRRSAAVAGGQRAPAMAPAAIGVESANFPACRTRLVAAVGRGGCMEATGIGGGAGSLLDAWPPADAALLPRWHAQAPPAAAPRTRDSDGTRGTA